MPCFPRNHASWQTRHFHFWVYAVDLRALAVDLRVYAVGLRTYAVDLILVPLAYRALLYTGFKALYFSYFWKNFFKNCSLRYILTYRDQENTLFLSIGICFHRKFPKKAKSARNRRYELELFSFVCWKILIFSN